MSQPCTVLIASADVLTSLSERLEIGDGEIVSFTDADALRALEAITSRKPAVVALERQFASTPRGTALINRIKADPGLKRTEIRVVAAHSEVPRGSADRAGKLPAPGGGIEVGTVTAGAPPPAAVQPLDQRGTRRVPRFKVSGQVNVVVDGNPASLIDVSTLGMQVVSSAVLRPNQRLRVGLNDEEGDIRLKATVAWASFEISPTGPRYRAGLEFLATHSGLEAYIARHRQQ